MASNSPHALRDARYSENIRVPENPNYGLYGRAPRTGARFEKYPQSRAASASNGAAGRPEQAGLSQQEVAKRLKRPQSFVSAYESRDRKIDVLEFLRIAKATGADPCEVLKR